MRLIERGSVRGSYIVRLGHMVIDVLGRLMLLRVAESKLSFEVGLPLVYFTKAASSVGQEYCDMRYATLESSQTARLFPNLVDTIIAPLLRQLTVRFGRLSPGRHRRDSSLDYVGCFTHYLYFTYLGEVFPAAGVVISPRRCHVTPLIPGVTPV